MLEVREVSKGFGPVQALDSVSLSFRPGEVHAVVGENGAGKSTLMHVLAGFLRPDRGSISWRGTGWPLGDPPAVRALGLGLIQQHFTLVGSFSVAENLALAEIDSLGRPLDAGTSSAARLKFGRSIGWELNGKALVRELPVGLQQRVEILKAIGSKDEILLFDEPTAPLSPAEVSDLLALLRRLADAGKVVILIAHKIQEILSVADSISVLRRGKLVWSGRRNEVDEASLVKMMVGELEPQTSTQTAQLGEVIVSASGLSVRGDRGETAVKDVSFEIQAGEIVGFGGVEGNGQQELAEALCGLRSHSGSLARPEPGYIPADRHAQGLALGLSVRENLLIGAVKRPDVLAYIGQKTTKIVDWCRRLVADYEIKANSIEDSVRGLSGGNQQKIVVGRVLDAKPKFVIAVNPARGLDVRATDYVHARLLEARNSGAAVALFSADLDELRALSDRSFAMVKGSLVAGDYAFSEASN